MFYIIFCLSIIYICSATVINYDLLVGDMSFYNQTLVFALSEHEKHGTDMLQLIENLMAPWHDGTLANEKTMVNECIILESEILIYSLKIICKTSRFLFYVTALSMLISFPYNCYRKMKSISNRKKN